MKSRESLTRIKALCLRNFKEIMRDPLSLIFLFALPVLMLIVFYLIFHNLTAQFEMKYLAPAMIVFGNAFIALFVGMLISTDRSSSFLLRLYTTPIKSYEYIIAYTVSVLPIAVLQSILILIVGGMMDFSLFSPRILLTLLMSLITALLYLGFGILFGSLCNEKSIGGLASFLVMCQSVLSGMWFPIEGMSKGFMDFMNALPFRSGALLMQNITMGITSFKEEVLFPLLVLSLYTIVVYVLAIVVYKYKMKDK